MVPKMCAVWVSGFTAALATSALAMALGLQPGASDRPWVAAVVMISFAIYSALYALANTTNRKE